jgi:hypothetical protein
MRLEHFHRLDVDVAVGDHSMEFTRFALNCWLPPAQLVS